jgi:N-acetylneuraminate synthase
MIEGIRHIELALGSGLKGPRPSEVKNKSIARKSLVAEQLILTGDVFSEFNMSIKRPGSGLSPIKYWDFLGRVAKKDYQIGDLINE